ncbi:50S ribosomal protein L32e, partial [ANME-1 cluster archaeon GoMg3.2]|nr:50S ribosomal protein L32e [ANME-1 cluster archaeon GoMg3.2]
KKEDRGLHPSGMHEVLIFNPNDLAKADPIDEVAVRIAATVGRRKREVIEEKAAALGIKVLNPMRHVGLATSE